MAVFASQPGMSWPDFIWIVAACLWVCGALIRLWSARTKKSATLSRNRDRFVVPRILIEIATSGYLGVLVLRAVGLYEPWMIWPAWLLVFLFLMWLDFSLVARAKRKRPQDYRDEF